MKKYKLRNLDCASCAQNLEYKLNKLAYIKKAVVNFSTSMLYIDYYQANESESLMDDIKKIESGVQLIKYNDMSTQACIVTKSSSELHKKKSGGNDRTDENNKVNNLLTRIWIGLLIFIPALLLETVFKDGNILNALFSRFAFFKSSSLILQFILQKTAALIGLLVTNTIGSKYIAYFNLSTFTLISFAVVYIVTGYKVVLTFIKNAIHGNFFDEQSLMSISTIGAFIIKAYSEAAGVMLFYVLGELLLEKSLYISRNRIRSLEVFRPATANVEKGNKIIELHPEDVKPNDIIIIKTGEKIPLDGLIIEGNSYIDTSAITGESIPVNVTKGSSVFAGSINTSSLLKMKATKSFAESSISKIIDLVEHASANKAKLELFITKFAKIYTPIIIFLALVTAVIPPLIFLNGSFTTWFYRAMILLVVSCPCALVLSIPLTYFVSLGSASKNGILIKGSQYLDTLSKVSIFAFDKTGTLTQGSLTLDKIIPLNNYKPADVLFYASAAEKRSSHPIAKSLHAYLNSANNDTIKRIHMKDLSDFNEIPGRGISCILDHNELVIGNDALLHIKNIPHSICYTESTVINVVYANKHIGYITFSDQLRKEAIPMVNELHKIGIKKLYMLTGDSEQTANHIANILSINMYHSQLMPEDKVNIVKNLKKQGTVAFVGDGINDAPILTASDIGISMGKHGTDIAIESSDIIITNDNLSSVPKLILLSRHTRSIVMQNIFIVLGIKIIFITLGLFGVATMWEAVFGDVGVSLITLFNAMRLMKT